MSKFSNIYDIDGNLIRGAEEGSFSIEETEELVDKLYNKVKHAESEEATEQEKEHLEIYRIYLDNANKWLMHLYDKMTPEERTKHLQEKFAKNNMVIENAKAEANDAEQAKLDAINKAMEELKAEYDKENNESNTPENETSEGSGEPDVVGEMERPVEKPETVNTPFTQTDLLVDRDEEAPIMNEYVEFEEVA